MKKKREMEPSTENEFTRYSLYLKKATEILAIVIISLGTLLFSLTSNSSRLGMSLFLSGVAIFIYVVIRKSKAVHPFFGYMVLWAFWLAHSYMLRDFGITGLGSFFYSVVLFLPVGIVFIMEKPKQVIEYRRSVILFTLILVSIIPNGDANAITSTPLISFLRCIFSIGIYIFLVFRYSALGMEIHPKYGIVVMTHLMYAFLAHIAVTISICALQLVFFSWMCIKRTSAIQYQKKAKDNGDEDPHSEEEQGSSEGE